MYIDIHSHKMPLLANQIAIYNANLEMPNKAIIFSSGIHPWYINERNLSKHLQLLDVLLKEKACIALGECGLDSLIEIPLALQIQVFEKQLEINLSYSKPVIIHCVKAFDAFLNITQPFDFHYIIHGFNKSEQLALQLLNRGFYLSFGKALLNNEKVQETFKKIPLDCIFLETDDADIAIEQIYLKAASIKQITSETLKERINLNFKKIVNL